MSSLKRMLVALTITYALSLTAYADECVPPPAPSKIPDGKTASEQEMLTAHDTMKQYNDDITTYVNCLAFEVKQHALSAAQEKDKRNLAIDGAQKVMDKFNDQLKVFKAKSG
jgi:hypothetical protein